MGVTRLQRFMARSPQEVVNLPGSSGEIQGIPACNSDCLIVNIGKLLGAFVVALVIKDYQVGSIEA